MDIFATPGKTKIFYLGSLCFRGMIFSIRIYVRSYSSSVENNKLSKIKQGDPLFRSHKLLICSIIILQKRKMGLYIHLSNKCLWAELTEKD